MDAGGKVLICGNGGSAAQSDHFMAEMTGSGFACVSLTNPAVITALANDYGYEKVFSHQIHALANDGDVLILLTTSGESENIKYAKWQAKVMSIEVINLPTKDKIKLDTQSIQEAHIKILHQIWKELHENR